MPRVEQIDERGRIGAQADHRHLRQFLPHQVALGRVVVAEHKAVDADVQIARDPAQAGHLVVPGTFERGKVRSPKNRTRVGEARFRYRRIVL